MSSNAVEKALWQIATSHPDAERLRNDPDAFMDEFRLDGDERRLLKSWNVSGLAARQVNPLLLMMAFTAVHGIHMMGEYVQRIHQPAGAA